MKIFTASQIKELDQKTISKQNISSWQLMQRDSEAFVTWFTNRFINKSVAVVCGPGNNGGDGLADARLLYYRSYSVKVYLFGEGTTPEDYNINLKKLKPLMPVLRINLEEDIPE